MVPTIARNIDSIVERIRDAAISVKRDPAEITLLAVSKKKSVSEILEAVSAGQKLFGENYVQEAVRKIEEISTVNEEVKFHFIGHLQSNKIPSIAGKFSCIQSIDSLKLANKINTYYHNNSLPPVDAMLQVNISGEDQKAGINKREVVQFFKDTVDLPYLNFIGLMAIGSFTEDIGVKTREFTEMKKLKNELKEEGFLLDHLSMGMTDDLELAIECGSTIVRVGTAIFGSR